jgi:hypothetical protein
VLVAQPKQVALPEEIQEATQSFPQSLQLAEVAVVAT